jgi:hypothetical protein
MRLTCNGLVRGLRRYNQPKIESWGCAHRSVGGDGSIARLDGQDAIDIIVGEYIRR